MKKFKLFIWRFGAIYCAIGVAKNICITNNWWKFAFYMIATIFYVYLAAKGADGD